MKQANERKQEDEAYLSRQQVYNAVHHAQQENGVIRRTDDAWVWGDPVEQEEPEEQEPVTLLMEDQLRVVGYVFDERPVAADYEGRLFAVVPLETYCDGQ